MIALTTNTKCTLISDATFELIAKVLEGGENAEINVDKELKKMMMKKGKYVGNVKGFA